MPPEPDAFDTPPPGPRPDRYQTLFIPLLVGLASLLLTLAFVHLGGEVVEGDTRGFDLRVSLGAQALRIGRPWLAEVSRDLSGLGSTTVLSLFIVATVGYLVLVRARTTALLVASSALTGSVLVSVLKSVFGRVRPDASLAEIVAQGLSFPSGHASMSAIVFLTLGALLASTHSRMTERTYIFATAALTTLLVGMSRIVLGVHWATDVLGGWAFGTAWALAWLLLARWLDRR
jgi:undecaprenyl-diphosphatase